MGGPTVHLTGVTLALGDPYNSLNAPVGSLGYLPEQEAQEFVPWVVLERFPGLAVATGAAAVYERDSDTRSGLPHRRGSIGGGFLSDCLRGGRKYGPSSP